MLYHNYKGLKYKDSLKRFLKDYRLRYNLYGKRTKWKTQRGELIKVKDLTKRHIYNIIGKFGVINIRTNYPYVYYRYVLFLKENE